MSDQPQDPPQPPPAAQEADSDRIARLRARSAPAESAPAPSTDVPAPSTDVPPPSADVPPPSADALPPRFAPLADPAPAAPAADPTLDDALVAGDAPAPAGAGRAGRPASPRMVVAVATAVLAATATALAGLVTSHVSSVNSVENTRADVIGAATSGVATVLSYDYRHLDSDFATAERLLTPHFRKQYDDTTAKGVKPLAAKYKAISSADVSAAGVVEASGTRAVVLVFVNQTVTNSQLAAPRLDRSRIDVTLVRSNGRWLIDKLTTL